MGTPGPVGPLVAGLTAFGLACFDFFWLVGLVAVVVEPEWPVRTWVFERELPVWRDPDEPPACVALWGAGDDGELVVVDVFGVLEGFEVVEGDGVVEVDVVIVVVGVVLVDGWQLAVTLVTGGVPGGSICAGGVPGAAFTVNVTVWPLSSVAVTVHTSAEAFGIAATPIVTMTMPMVMIAIFSLWPIDTLVLSPPATDLSRPEWAGAARQGR